MSLGHRFYGILLTCLLAGTSCSQREQFIRAGEDAGVLTGQWRIPVDYSRSDYIQQQTRTADISLILREDGTFTSSAVPMQSRERKDKAIALTASGTWAIEDGVAYRKVILSEGTNSWCSLVSKQGNRIYLVTELYSDGLYPKTRLSRTRPTEKNE